MFKNPFSFSGRIRRLEYGLSYIIYIISFSFGALIFDEIENGEYMLSFLFIAAFWFFIAQGAKRCHDLGNSLFYQFIPLYGLWMLFAESEGDENRYGLHPKKMNQKHTVNVREFFINNENYSEKLPKMLSVVLLNVLIVVVSLYFYKRSEMTLFLIASVSIIINYLLLLVIDREMSNRYKLQGRIAYALLLYIFLRIYSIIFLRYRFDWELIFYEFFGTIMILKATYISQLIYLNYFEKKEHED